MERPSHTHAGRRRFYNRFFRDLGGSFSIYARKPAFGLALAAFLLLAAECFFAYKEYRLTSALPQVGYSSQEYVANSLLGYSSLEGLTRATSARNGKILYDVLYTKNKYGLRVTPHDLVPSGPAPGSSDVVFLGCSFTYGEGVNDKETAPYLFEEGSGGKYRAYNFGFHGYGPQQMLLILDSDIVDTVVPGSRPAIAVYQALPGHVARCAFKYPAILWYKGPSCELDGNSEVAVKGYAEVTAPLKRLLLKSRLLKRWYYRVTKTDVDLFLKTVKKSKELFERKYSGKFLLLFWDGNDRFSRQVLAELRKEGIRVFLVSDILGVHYGEKEFVMKYTVREDGHPNGPANTLIAEYLLANIGSENQLPAGAETAGRGIDSF